jgi:hypothetical protein
MADYTEICRKYEQGCGCVKPNTNLKETHMCGYVYSKPFDCPHSEKVVCGFYAAYKEVN